jgi:hypothetical protein
LGRPQGPIFFHFESGFAGHTSHMIVPTSESSSPNASPIFSP